MYENETMLVVNEFVSKRIHCKIICSQYLMMVDKFGICPIVLSKIVQLFPADLLSVPFSKLEMAIISDYNQ